MTVSDYFADGRTGKTKREGTDVTLQNNPLPDPCRTCFAGRPTQPGSYDRFYNDKGVQICAYVADGDLTPADEVFDAGHAVWHMVNPTNRGILCKLFAELPTHRCQWGATDRNTPTAGKIAIRKHIRPWHGLGRGPSERDSESFHVETEGVSDVATTCAFNSTLNARSPFRARKHPGGPPLPPPPSGPSASAAPGGSDGGLPDGGLPDGGLPDGGLPDGGAPEVRIAPVPARPAAVPPTAASERVVVCVDLYRYHEIATHLAENEDVGLQAQAVLNLNKQVERLIRNAMSEAEVNSEDPPLQFTGDGALVVLHRPDSAHDFAIALHRAAERWNAQRRAPLSHRHFRIGIFMDEVVIEGRPAPDGGSTATRFAGTAIANAVRLEGECATGDVLIGTRAWGLLSRDRQARYGREEVISGKRDEQILAKRWHAVVPPASDDPKAKHDT